MKSAKMMRVLNFIWKYLGTFHILPQLGIQVVYSYIPIQTRERYDYESISGRGI